MKIPNWYQNISGGLMFLISAISLPLLPSNGCEAAELDVKSASVVAPAVQPVVVVPEKLPVLPPLKAKPGYIIGRAVYADGRPMPDFSASALGWTGEIHLGPSGTIPNLGQVDGKNGYFEFKPTSAFDRKVVLKEASVTVLRAEAIFTYNERKYQLAMYPLDGKEDGSGEKSFRGETVKGVVRDFVLKIQGPKRGFETGLPPKDTTRNERSDPSYDAYYGGTAYLDLDNRTGNAPEMAVLKGSQIKVTFKPVGQLMDGSPGQTLVRTITIEKESYVGHSFYFRDIPLGDYTATLELTKPDGMTYSLRSKVLGGKWSDTTPVVFMPFNTISSVAQFSFYAIR